VRVCAFPVLDTDDFLGEVPPTRMVGDREQVAGPRQGLAGVQACTREGLRWLKRGSRFLLRNAIRGYRVNGDFHALGMGNQAMKRGCGYPIGPALTSTRFSLSFGSYHECCGEGRNVRE